MRYHNHWTIYSQPNVLGSTWLWVDSPTCAQTVKRCARIFCHFGTSSPPIATPSLQHAYTHSFTCRRIWSRLWCSLRCANTLNTSLETIRELVMKYAASVVRREAEGTVVYYTAVQLHEWIPPATTKSIAQTRITHGSRTVAGYSGPHAGMRP
jgi:hypothetical protein